MEPEISAMPDKSPLHPDLFGGDTRIVAPEKILVDRKEYVNRCRQRWHGFALRDALSNYATYKKHHDYLIEAMREYLKNPGQHDGAEKWYNPSGNLTSFLWNCQKAINPSGLYPFLDFEEHFQKVFLRRGLLIYCELILNQLNNNPQ